MRCIALLRGINVSGQKSLKMADLKKAFELLSFRHVLTYAQSGNVIFDCDSSERASLVEHVEKGLSEAFGVPLKVIIRTHQELERIVKNNPLVQRAHVKPDKLHVTFLFDTPDETAASALEAKLGRGEMFQIIGNEVYLYCPNGYARTKLSNAMVEAKLKTIATTRNWKTVNKLLVLSAAST
ncbi:MAG TPA: DUF1697 domain-containing protein [Candidatus Bathyarchaeia archaeon]|nr:DUF1697 domain-containing protein [Candidatus Bathyarchaeia archaeon]